MKMSIQILFLLSALHFQVCAQSCGFDEKIAALSEKDPNIYNRFKQLFRNNSNTPNQRQEIVIPIVVHILWNNESQNISDDAIHEQINILNRDFNNQGDLSIIPKEFRPFITESGIRFC